MAIIILKCKKCEAWFNADHRTQKFCGQCKNEK